MWRFRYVVDFQGIRERGQRPVLVLSFHKKRDLKRSLLDKLKKN